MMNTATSTLDHVVVNAMFETDAAASCFEALGFASTPRGYHSLGSVNHLMMFDGHYLELVGLPPGATTLRREILESRLGIDGLVFKTDDAQETYARLIDAGVRASEPQSFTRPVDIEGVEQIARFRTTRLAAEELSAGRVYFCEHLTPEWVFRAEWTKHPNGAQRLKECVIVSDDPQLEARRYALIAGESDLTSPSSHRSRIALRDFDLDFIDGAAYRARYGDLVCNAAGRDSYFGAVVVEVSDLAAMRARLDALASHVDESVVRLMAPAHAQSGVSSVVVLLGELNTVIEFIGAVEHAHA
ncbi:hypothetical protein BCh11DRAFT_00968 [Burkholderia sp. Ch1-1]|uniref:VOC family protein n=1 Tax=Paraburkholderia sp. USG1 TaxID=2952268 RepID=UPI0001D22C7E|nr:VOC family protein [Paraburkholderia sp. USG1]EIF33203.1 hypothetical protein BCh11DRAFT_00968 [Burkholderia sp. Ch1-1]MDR8399926.1 VOC family protein [Paraburkholderia sp. USG1]